MKLVLKHYSLDLLHSDMAAAAESNGVVIGFW